jgi:peptide/nickel transport system substrate-binding protein
VLQGGFSGGYREEATSKVSLLHVNDLHPPFDNPAIRRALLGAVNQEDFMTG